jgi:uncharacterized protein DUF4180
MNMRRNMHMNFDLRIVEEAGVRVLEASSAEPLIATADDIDRVIESCLSNGVRAALLYAGNLPEAFFDLSSGQTGTILQKMRNYGVCDLRSCIGRASFG